MSHSSRVLCAGIIVADHLCHPIAHVPAAGELVMTDHMLLTIGGCAANAAVDLVKMGVAATVAGRVGDDVFGRIVADMLRADGVDVSRLKVSPGAETSQTLIVNVAGEDRPQARSAIGAHRRQLADVLQLRGDVALGRQLERNAGQEDTIEEALQDPDGERQVEGGVSEDQAGQGADQIDRAEDRIERDHHRDHRRHSGGDDPEQQVLLSPELGARQAVGGHGPEHDRDQRRAERRQQAADALKARLEQDLRGIEAQARARLQESVAEGQKVAAEIRAQAQKEAQDRLARAEDEMMREREKAKEILKEQVIRLSLTAAEKILKSKLDDPAQRKLAGQFIDEVGSLR